MTSFIFGGNTGQSYEQIQNKRRIADALTAQSMSQAPRDIGSGLHAVGQALMIRKMRKDADKADAKGRADYEGSRGQLMSALMGRSPAGSMPAVAAPKPPAQSPDVDIANDTMRALGRDNMVQGPDNWDAIRAGIFAGESGGDYDALYGYSNRPGGKFSNVKLTDMTVDEALNFAAPSGEYGQHVKGQIGRVATPMGAYQIVGTTLRGAKEALGLTGNERMTPELQERLGQHIYQTQGTGAWEGYKGPQSGGTGVRVAQSGQMDPTVLMQIAELANSPYAKPGERAVMNAMLERQLQASDPLRQMQLQKAQLELQQMQNPQLSNEDRYKVVDGQLVDLGADGGPSAVDLGGSGIAPANLEDESKLRKEFTGLQPVKDFQKQAGAYARIVASAEDPSAAGDLALIFNYMKLLDPGSVVRESEFATAANATGVDDRVRNLYNRLLSGERLAPQQRTDFVGRAAKLYQQASSQHERVAEQYGLSAEAYGLDPDRTIPDFRYKPQGAPPTSLRPNARPGTPEAQAAEPPQPAQDWQGPSANEIRGMDTASINAMLSAYDIRQIPSDVLSAIEERLR
ncbi:hypothetical protein [Ruegeria jejuensis]|uniref:hypothetical protein n=1 Tax=Ruegeria jejuensis TaxID=3233338 RepID=UPI00355B42E3